VESDASHWLLFVVNGMEQMAEWRISVYGTSPKEWSHLAHWVLNNRLVSPHLKWVIQVPRLYHVFKETNEVHSFQDLLDSTHAPLVAITVRACGLDMSWLACACVADVFFPLFEVTKNPSSDPVLHRFITEHVSGFDSVDNEDVTERKDLKTCPADPRRWDTNENPPYAYYLYFMWANVWSLNKYRETRGLNTFDFRFVRAPPACAHARVRVLTSVCGWL
jgi:AMP deaminase